MTDRCEAHELARLQKQVRKLKDQRRALTQGSEDIFLLGTISQKVMLERSFDRVLHASLDCLVDCRDLAYCAYLSVRNDEVHVDDDLGLCGGGSLAGRTIPTTKALLQALEAGGAFVLLADVLSPVNACHCTKVGDSAMCWVLPICQRTSVGALVCATDAREQKYLCQMRPLLNRVCEVIQTRLETLSLVAELTELNQTLEARVLRRTQELAESNARLEGSREKLRAFRELIEHSSDAVYVIEPETGRFLDSNETACKMLGYSKDELLAMSICDVDLAFADLEAWQEYIRNVKGSIRPSILHFEHRRKDGTVFPVDVTARLVAYRGKSYRVVHARNVTERRGVEKTLLRLAAAVDQAADSVVMTDPQATIEYVNPAFERTTKYSKDEVVGQNVSLLRSGKHDAAFFEEMWDELKCTGAWRGQLIERAKDGRLIHQDTSISATRNSEGQLCGYVSSHRDITQKVEMEAYVAQVQRLEAIGILAGGVAHDFNNILTAIIGYNELATLAAEAGAEVNTFLKGIKQASKRASELVRRLLSFARGTRQEVAPVRLSMIVGEALKLMRAALPSTIEIRSQLSSRACIMADASDVHRVIVNLCTNAGLAMKDGGGVLEVSTSDVELDDDNVGDGVETDPGRYVRLCVRDNGCGIPPDVIERIFEPFFTMRKEGSGSGMGLAVVQGVVKSLHGKITVESAPESGAMFQILLPVVDQPEAQTPTWRPALDVRSGRVLFVDDESSLAEVADTALSHFGYQVVTFSSGLDALEAFRASPDDFDVVVTDMTMPGITGDVLAQSVKAIRPRMPVVLCTGFSDEMSAEVARAVGIDEFLMKPFAMGRLAEVICAVISSSQSKP